MDNNNYYLGKEPFIQFFPIALKYMSFKKQRTGAIVK